MTWFIDQRYAWIKECLTVYGYINREHLERKFGISTPQASADLNKFAKLYPELMIYNKSTKRYERNLK